MSSTTSSCRWWNSKGRMRLCHSTNTNGRRAFCSAHRCSAPRTRMRQVAAPSTCRSEEHTSELQSRPHLVCRLLLEKKKKKQHSLTAVLRITGEYDQNRSRRTCELQ